MWIGGFEPSVIRSRCPRSRARCRKPDRAVNGIDDGAVAAYGNALVDGGVDLAVAVGVKISGAPAFGLLHVAGLVVHLGVEPAKGLCAGPAEIQRVVLVKAELEMVRVEAGVNGSELLCLGIVDCRLFASRRQSGNTGRTANSILVCRNRNWQTGERST